MYKKINYITAVLVLLISISVNAQVTTQSPYSKFGIGNIKGPLLPQFRAMGGVSTAINKPSGYNNINMQNPASYGSINFTTIDVGMTGTFSTLKRDGESNKSFNSTLSHVALAFPITHRSALSIGILPYSEVGYDFTEKGRLASTDPSNPAGADVNYTYTGEGGLTKAYIGYGYQIGSHLRIGANMEYLFGNIIENKSTEFIADPTAYATRLQNKNSIAGVSFSYGAQYDIRLSSKTSLNFGYSGSSASTVNSTRTFLATKYTFDATSGDEQGTLETIDSVRSSMTKFKLPLIHNFGIALQKDNKWVFGADFRTGNWSKLTMDGINQGLQDSYGVSVGGQITPDYSSINSYFKRVDYRFGFSYDKSYIKQNEQDIKQMAFSFGLGLPLANAMSRLAFYKLNLTTEIGRRGTTSNGLLQENFVTLHIGFTLNDSWFRRFQFQ